MKEGQYVPDMYGCSDGGCIFHYKAPGTMVTNGGCSCERELNRSEEGRKAVRLIRYMRANWQYPAYAGDIVQQAGQHAYPSIAMYQPERKTDDWVYKPGKVTMIKQVREACLHFGCGLKEAKEAVDKHYDCIDPVSAAILYLEKKYMPAGYCRMGDNCLCGGDTPGVQAGCFEWKSL